MRAVGMLGHMCVLGKRVSFGPMDVVGGKRVNFGPCCVKHHAGT